VDEIVATAVASGYAGVFVWSAFSDDPKSDFNQARAALARLMKPAGTESEGAMAVNTASLRETAQQQAPGDADTGRSTRA
jgi:hypothetical protein